MCRCRTVFTRSVQLRLAQNPGRKSLKCWHKKDGDSKAALAARETHCTKQSGTGKNFSNGGTLYKVLSNKERGMQSALLPAVACAH